jgi:hypothetical protein
LWASLQAALEGYPLLLSQELDRAGTVDTAKLAVLKDKRVVRQGGRSAGRMRSPRLADPMLDAFEITPSAGLPYRGAGHPETPSHNS